MLTRLRSLTYDDSGRSARFTVEAVVGQVRDQAHVFRQRSG
ncbi:hypothetical protein SSAG_06934 [Streptomyces sp. Mg1]|nr:hypothetical protein SSAG_06934 [Streptomyces sp. Mg1]